jgi:hypothetical protein
MGLKEQRQEGSQEQQKQEEEELTLSPVQSPRYLSNSPSDSSESSDVVFQDLHSESPSSQFHATATTATATESEEEIVTPLDTSERSSASSPSQSTGNGTFDLSVTMIDSQETSPLPSPPMRSHLFQDKPKRKYLQRQELLGMATEKTKSNHNHNSHLQQQQAQGQVQAQGLGKGQAQAQGKVQGQEKMMPLISSEKSSKNANSLFEKDYFQDEESAGLERFDELSDSDSELGSEGQFPEDRFGGEEDSYYLEEDLDRENEKEESHEDTRHRQGQGHGQDMRSREKNNPHPHRVASSRQQEEWDDDDEAGDEEEEEEEYSAVDREDHSNITSIPIAPRPSSFEPEVLLHHLKSSKREMSSQHHCRSVSPKSRGHKTTGARSSSPLQSSPKPSPRPQKSQRDHSPKARRPLSPSSSSSRVLQFEKEAKGDHSTEIVKELSIRADNVDPLEVAIEVFDSATTLANEGNLEDAIPLYLHVRLSSFVSLSLPLTPPLLIFGTRQALKIFEEFNYEELPMIREEIWRWVSLADEATAAQYLRREKHHHQQLQHQHSGRRASSSSRSRSPRSRIDNFQSSETLGGGAMSLSEIKSPKRQHEQQGQRQEQERQEEYFLHQNMTASRVGIQGGHSSNSRDRDSSHKRNSLRAPSIDLL